MGVAREELLLSDQANDRAGRTAVILNANAKRVTPKVREQVEAAAPDADVFFTRSLDEAAFVTRRVADLGYDTIVTGGGDGTVANTIDQVLARLDEQGIGRTPRVGVLRLGTGNAVADFLGARDFRQDLPEIGAAPTRRVNLLEIDGQRRSPFCGFGWDAYILNNYDRLKTMAQRFAVTRALFKNVLGYLIAGVGKSAPELMVKRPKWKVRIVNTGPMGLKLNARGEILERIPTGAVVYDGPAQMGCFGCTPFYGFRFRIMPFADRTPGMYHLRLIDNLPAGVAVMKLRQVWNGSIDHPGIHDFQLSSCRVTFADPAPFQVAGDPAGLREQLDVRIARRVLDCVTFS